MKRRFNSLKNFAFFVKLSFESVRLCTFFEFVLLFRDLATLFLLLDILEVSEFVNEQNTLLKGNVLDN
jgi:hypothetical protein